MDDRRRPVRGVIMRVLVLSTVLSVTFGIGTGPTLATDGDAGSGGASGDVIWAGVQTSSPPQPGSRDGKGCRWDPEAGYDASTRHLDLEQVTVVRRGVRYRLFTRTCRKGWRLVWVPDLSPERLAEQASVTVYGKLPRPKFNFAPSVDRVVVEVGTWMWASRSMWKPISATAWIPTPAGVIWARTTATPIFMGFATPDDVRPSSRRRSITCLGPGLPWTTIVGDGLDSPCTFTYEHASSTHAGEVYRAETSITWAITWTSNVGVGGVLPPYTTRQPLTVRVQELQALVR